MYIVRRTRAGGLQRLWSLCLLLLFTPGLHAAGELSDSQLKVAFVFNFLKFTDWPAPDAASPLNLCVVNADRELETAFLGINGRQANGRALRVNVIRTGESFHHCQVLYVRQGGRPLDLKLLQQTQRDLLSIGDAEGFAEEGGVIGLVEREGQLRFSINMDAVRQSPYRFSAQLLRLAYALVSEKKQ